MEGSSHFLLNMRILADALERQKLWLEFYGSNDLPRLENIRPYYEGIRPKEQFVYLVSEEHAEVFLRENPGCSCIINGRISPALIPEKCSVILLLQAVSEPMLFAEIQDIFERYRTWDWALQRAAESSSPLDTILEASTGIFRNPIFIHDANFYILSSTEQSQGMAVRTLDPRTGRQMVSLETINEYRADAEYLSGLKSRRTKMYVAGQTGSRCLFRNLWKGSHYEGRIQVDEVENSIQPGDFYALDYLGQTLERYIRQNQISWISEEKNMDLFFSDFLKNGHTDERQAIAYLQQLGWNRDDRYYCVRIVTEQKDFTKLSASAILGQLEETLPECISFYFDNSVSVIINLAGSGESIADLVSRLAIIIREGLLKVGISSEVEDFYAIPKAYEQARIALSYGTLGGNMYWYYYFDTYMLDYILDCAGREMPLNMLGSDALKKLRHYDQENNAELYHTLESYLRLEKNMLQTSKELYIHRSTLAYRLEKIQKLIGVDLDDPKERLKLLISYYMEEGFEG